MTMTTQQAAGPMLLLFVLLAATTAVAGTSPSSSSSFSAGAIAVQYTVSNDTIGPVDQQYNGTHKIVDCTSPGECISAASSICSVNFTSWCHAFAIEDLWGTARDDPFSLATNGDHSQQQQRQVQFYSSSPEPALAGHPRWTYFTDGRGPPTPPQPPRPVEPSVQYCTTKQLVYNYTAELAAGTCLLYTSPSPRDRG